MSPILLAEPKAPAAPLPLEREPRPIPPWLSDPEVAAPVAPAPVAHHEPMRIAFVFLTLVALTVAVLNFLSD